MLHPASAPANTEKEAGALARPGLAQRPEVSALERAAAGHSPGPRRRGGGLPPPPLRRCGGGTASLAGAPGPRLAGHCGPGRAHCRQIFAGRQQTEGVHGVRPRRHAAEERRPGQRRGEPAPGGRREGGGQAGAWRGPRRQGPGRGRGVEPRVPGRTAPGASCCLQPWAGGRSFASRATLRAPLRRASGMVTNKRLTSGTLGEWHGLEGGPAAPEVIADPGILLSTPAQARREVGLEGTGQAVRAPPLLPHAGVAVRDELD